MLELELQQLKRQMKSYEAFMDRKKETETQQQDASELER